MAGGDSGCGGRCAARGRCSGMRRAQLGPGEDARRHRGPPRVQEVRPLQAHLRRGLSDFVDDAVRGAGARLQDLCRRTGAGAAGRRNAEPRPGHQGSGRAELHVPDLRQGPDQDPPAGVEGLPPREDPPGPDGGEPSRSGAHRAQAGRGGGGGSHQPGGRLHARRPGAREVPGDLRRPVGNHRRVPSAGERRLRRFPGSHGDHRVERALGAMAEGRGVDRLPGPAAGPDLRPVPGRLGSSQWPVALDADSRPRPTAGPS